MKNICVFGLMFMLFGSCNNADLEIEEEGVVIDTRLHIGFVDQLLQDRLNPESPSYFGESYAEGIKILYLYEGTKYTFRELWVRLEGDDEFPEFPEDYVGVQSPIRSFEDLNIDQNTFGYYFIYVNPMPIAVVDGFIYCYIQYPDGKEDEIKTELLIKPILCFGRIWINDELIYSRVDNYYNTKFYLWLEPVLDDDGKQIGNLVRPKNGSDLALITK